ncbi:homocitrate synthase [Petroclostridium xylanilyticum]|jgi:homocitrate synthase NifV|uniref:homocitrate synthase n=1 Tax=Petroclostridium xylanilyticum TaxID=1792311 RepID=UPI000B984DFD|nr:homocitrate synthase [Petroclostridium xylanilyticum]
MEVYIVDTTLRDGEQKAGLALGSKDKIEIAKILDRIGVYQIEAGTPAMGGDEKKSIEKMMELNLKSKISAWNRMNLKDIEQSVECGVDIIHISVPSSDIHIKSKLNKDRIWVVNNMKRCICFAKEKGFEVTIGLEDASRADFMFLIHICEIALSLGVRRIRYADTVGILHPQRIFEEVKQICTTVDVDVGIHVHNDFGMAVANSIAAVQGGAKYVDCTIGGIGERAGNCNYVQFIKALDAFSYINKKTDIKNLKEAEREIRNIFNSPLFTRH